MPIDPAPRDAGGPRERLASSRRPLTGSRDRRVHAITTAILGVTVGVVMAAQNLLAGPGGTALRGLGYLVVVVGALVWVERAARTVPHHAKVASRLELGGSLVMSLTVVLPWLNLAAQCRPNTLVMAIAGAIVLAVPSWIAAGWIARARRGDVPPPVRRHRGVGLGPVQARHTAGGRGLRQDPRGLRRQTAADLALADPRWSHGLPQPPRRVANHRRRPRWPG